MNDYKKYMIGQEEMENDEELNKFIDYELDCLDQYMRANPNGCLWFDEMYGEIFMNYRGITATIQNWAYLTNQTVTDILEKIKRCKSVPEILNANLSNEVSADMFDYKTNRVAKAFLMDFYITYNGITFTTTQWDALLRVEIGTVQGFIRDYISMDETIRVILDRNIDRSFRLDNMGNVVFA